jgi:hypothetical protein
MPHTKGPWTIKIYVCERHWVSTEGNPRFEKRYIYEVAMETGGCIQFKTEADARLVAAAPDLLEACKLGLDYLKRSDSYRDGETYPALLKAIAKAEGQSDE